MVLKSKTLEIFKVPKSVRRASEWTGLVLATVWLGYVAYISLTNGLGWPPSDDRDRIVVITLLAFALGWTFVRLGFCLLHRPQKSHDY
jgi:hypothetical protein